MVMPSLPHFISISDGGTEQESNIEVGSSADQDIGLYHKYSGNHQPLHLPAGKFERIFIIKLLIFQIDKFAGILPFFPFFLFEKCAPIPAISDSHSTFINPEKLVEGKNGSGKSPEYFANMHDVLSDFQQPRFPFIQDFSAGFFQHPSKISQGGFPGARSTDDRNYFALMIWKIDVNDRIDGIIPDQRSCTLFWFPITFDRKISHHNNSPNAVLQLFLHFFSQSDR
jgi:hypothetical protein